MQDKDFYRCDIGELRDFVNAKSSGAGYYDFDFLVRATIQSYRMGSQPPFLNTLRLAMERPLSSPLNRLYHLGILEQYQDQLLQHFGLTDGSLSILIKILRYQGLFIDVHLETSGSKFYTIANYTTNIYSNTPNDPWYHALLQATHISLEKNPPCSMGIQHREIGFFSNNSQGYKYAGQVSQAAPVPGTVQQLMDVVNGSFGTQFNGCLINHYTNGHDYLGAHGDDERGLSNGMVVGLSYGPGIRKFRIRRKDKASFQYGGGDPVDPEQCIPEMPAKKFIDVEMSPQMCIAMTGNFQKEFTHEIPKQTRVEVPRLSCTFRTHTI